MRKTPFFVLAGIGLFVYGGFVGFNSPGWFMAEERNINNALSEDFAQSLGGKLNVTSITYNKHTDEDEMMGFGYPGYQYTVKTDNGRTITNSVRLNREKAEDQFTRTQLMAFSVQDDQIQMAWNYDAEEGESIDTLYKASSNRFNTYDDYEVYEEARLILKKVQQKVSGNKASQE